LETDPRARYADAMRSSLARPGKEDLVEIGAPVREIEIVPAEEPVPDPVEVPQGDPSEVPA
jgi:hypothetical protein